MGGDGQYYDLVSGIRWVSVLPYRGSDHRQQEGKASNLNVFTLNTRQVFENSDVLNLIQMLYNVYIYHNIVTLLIHTSFVYLCQ